MVVQHRGKLNKLITLSVISVLVTWVFAADTELVYDLTFPLKRTNLIKTLPDPFDDKPRTLALATSDPYWNTRLVDPNLADKKVEEQVDKIVDKAEPAVINNAFILRVLHQGVDIMTPVVVPMDWYLKKAIKHERYKSFKNQAVEKLTKRTRLRNNRTEASLRLLSTNIGNTTVDLRIKGQIDINGGVIFENRETTQTNFREAKSWDLDITQKQRFEIEGTIGDRLTVAVDQNSEADFAWENNLILNYKGKRDDIWQSGVAGNLSLNLPSSAQFVNDGTTKSNGLFGIKLQHQLGPLDITTIVSREQVKKASQTYKGGESQQEVKIFDYNYIKDKYFFVDEKFKAQYYPLNEENQHVSNRAIAKYDLYKLDAVNGNIFGKAYLNGDVNSEINESGRWTQLIEGEDYSINIQTGVIKMKTSISSTALGIGYIAGQLDRIPGSDGADSTIIVFDEATCFEMGDCAGDWNYVNEEELFEDLNGNEVWDPADTVIIVSEYVLLYNEPLEKWFEDINGNEQYDAGEEINISYEGSLVVDQDGHRLFKDVNLNGLYDETGEPYTDTNGDGQYTPGEDIVLKLLKAKDASDPSKPTWPLMLKNVYSLGATNIQPDDFEIKIVHEKGNLGTEEYSPNGVSFLHIFGLDNWDPMGNPVEGGDGIFDNAASIIDYSSGELFLPMHLPFAYDAYPRTDQYGQIVDQFGNAVTADGDTVYWGNSNPELAVIYGSNVTPLNDPDNDFDLNGDGDKGPSIYYATTNVNAESQFAIVVKLSKKNSKIDLNAFMIVEGSEEVRLNGKLLRKDEDYSIDYFTGVINFNPVNCQECTDPTANIQVSYEENEIVSFDQKIMVGTSMELNMGDNFRLGGVAMYYNQSIVDEKVDIGYEPVRNFIWDLNGKYARQNIDMLTKAVDWLPFIETDKPSNFSVEGEFAEVFPNPNPLGQAFLDDFESSKRTTSLQITQRNWKIASPPIGRSLDSRGKLSWYNPYFDVATNDIWPNLEVSTRANNQTTKVLALEAYFNSDSPEDTLWNGITTSLYASDFNLSEHKYFEIWLNTEDMAHDSLNLHIDIGFISEDINDNGELDTEDEPFTSGGFGNRILDDGEDVGIDGCPDEKEDGFGGCLAGDATYDNPGGQPVNTSPGIDPDDPNGDNWCYISDGCGGNDDYRFINGTEGNGFMAGFTYPDTEDLNNDDTLDDRDDYFTFTLKPNLHTPVSETVNNGMKTGWKLFRILLNDFKPEGPGNVDWTDVEFVRLWIDGLPPDYSQDATRRLMIAKMEIVRNEWVEEGVAHIDSLQFVPDSTFSVAVANTDENSDYESPPGVVGEYDEYYGVRTREQSLVLAFEKSSHIQDGGIEPEHIVAAKKIISTGTSYNSDFDPLSYLAYRNLEMYVFGRPDTINGGSWHPNDSSSVNLVFRFGKDNDNYYEIVKPVYEGWDERNHLNIELEKLVRYKLNIQSLDNMLSSQDTGLDSVKSMYEDGCGGKLDGQTYQGVLDLLEISGPPDFYQMSLGDTITVCGNQYWTELVDGEERCSNCSLEDPNGDDWRDCGADAVCPDDPGYIQADEGEGDGIWTPGEEGMEGNGIFDFVDAGEMNGLHDTGELCEPFEDYNNNGQFDLPPDDYNDELGYWEWKESDCTACQTVRIKGKPSIKQIYFLVLGVENNTDEKVFGQVLVDELRMTNVKKERGRAIRLRSSLNLADLLDMSVDFSRKDAEFHSLRQRLGTGDTRQTVSITTRFSPDKFLPLSWGVKLPLTITYSSQEAAPKYYPGTDILTGKPSVAPDSIKTITRNVNINTSLKKNKKSDNWLLRYTIDSFSINNLTGKYSFSSDETYKSKINKVFSGDASYKLNFGDNYIRPFKFFGSLPVVGDFLNNTRFYWTPKSFESSMFLESSDKVDELWAGTVTENPTFKMTRKFGLNYQLTKSFGSNYSRTVKSNLIRYADNKMQLLKDLSPGMITQNKETWKNSFRPDFLKWLKPSITYSTSYSWNRTNDKDITSPANIASSSELSYSSTVNLTNLIEQVYTPDNKASSSRSRQRSRTRGGQQQAQKKKKEIKNPVLLAILKPMHSVASRFSNISISYRDKWTHSFNGITGAPDMLYKMGFSGDPGINWHPDVTPSYSRSFVKELNLNTTLSITRTLSSTLKFRMQKDLTEQYLKEDILQEKVSFLPLGDRGDKGIPVPTWNISWSGLDKLPLLNRVFKSLSLNHGFQGDRSIRYQGGEQDQSDYTMSFSPLLGFNAKLKGKIPVDINVSVKHSITIKNQGVSTERNYSNGFSSSFTYRHDGGMAIPLFFFRDFEFDNQITVKMTMNYDHTYQLKRVTYDGDFGLNNSSKNFTVKPTIDYFFTKYVSGGFYFNYTIREDRSGKQTTEKDIGFNVKIKIQG